MRELAPQTDYVTGSPDCGDVHFWEVWHGGKPFEVYRNIHGFVSEFGFQSFPEPKTVRTFTEPADRESVYSPVMKYHERSNRMYMDVKEDGKIGTDKIMMLVKKYFRDPKDFESTLWLSQITQALRHQVRGRGLAARDARDRWAASTGSTTTSGPCSSWSSVDYFGRWKALHYLARRFYAPVLVSGAEDAKAGKVDVYVTSDRMSDCQGKLTWTVTDVAGKTLGSTAVERGHSRPQEPRWSSRSRCATRCKATAPRLLVWLRLDVDGQTESPRTW